MNAIDKLVDVWDNEYDNQKHGSIIKAIYELINIDFAKMQ